MREMTEDESLYTPKELAGYLKVSEETLSWWRRTGTGPEWFHAGRHPRYRAEDVREWQREQIRKRREQQAASA